MLHKMCIKLIMNSLSHMVKMMVIYFTRSVQCDGSHHHKLSDYSSPEN